MRNENQNKKGVNDMDIKTLIDNHREDIDLCKEKLKRNPDSITRELISDKINLHERFISELGWLLLENTTPAVKSFTCEHLKISEGIDRCMLFGYCDPRRCIRHD